MAEFFNMVFLGNSLKQWLVAGAFVLGGLAAGKLCSLLTMGILKSFCKKTKTDIDNLVVNTLKQPLAVLVLLLGFVIGLRDLNMGQALRLWTGRALTSLFIVIITWALARIIDQVILRVIPENENRIRPLLRKFFGLVLWLIAAALILRTIGYNVSALMAGLGLGGAALALASKDTLANFFGSITVFVDRPFRLNDRIRIGSYDGVITEMGIRTSRLRTLENRVVFIPNSLFAAQPIENISVQPNIKVAQTIQFKSENGSEKIAQGIAIIRETAAAVPGLEGNASTGLVAIGGVSCQVSFVFYVSKRADYNETLTRLNMELFRRFEEAGIRLV
jgi:MscS family membrane protein